MATDELTLRQKIFDLLIGEVEYDNHFAPTEKENTANHIEVCGELADEIMREAEQLIADKERAARVEENEQALYIYENQVSNTYALMGALAGAKTDLSKGIFVETKDGKVVITGKGLDFKLPQFFKDRIATLTKKQEEKI